MSDNNEIVLYQPDALTKIDVCVADETVWLTQQQLAMLFGTEVPAISKHIRNIYKSEELNKSATLSKMEIVQTEGIEHLQQWLIQQRLQNASYKVQKSYEKTVPYMYHAL